MAYCDPKDNIMGIGFDRTAEESNQPEKWGQNRVGNVLEKVREHIMQKPFYQNEVKQARKEVAEAKKQ